MINSDPSHCYLTSNQQCKHFFFYSLNIISIVISDQAIFQTKKTSGICIGGLPRLQILYCLYKL